jgi:hypothetical protein
MVTVFTQRPRQCHLTRSRPAVLLQVTSHQSSPTHSQPRYNQERTGPPVPGSFIIYQTRDHNHACGAAEGGTERVSLGRWTTYKRSHLVALLLPWFMGVRAEGRTPTSTEVAAKLQPYLFRTLTPNCAPVQGCMVGLHEKGKATTRASLTSSSPLHRLEAAPTLA